jgi:hypothetical protein
MLEPAKVKANEAHGKIASTWMTSLPELGLWGALNAIKKHMTKVVRTIEWTGPHTHTHPIFPGVTHSALSSGLGLVVRVSG